MSEQVLMGLVGLKAELIAVVLAVLLGVFVVLVVVVAVLVAPVVCLVLVESVVRERICQEFVAVAGAVVHELGSEGEVVEWEEVER
jgi:hypothetical protein